MKHNEWRRTRFGEWILVNEYEEARDCFSTPFALERVTRYIRNQRNFGRHMNTTMRYW